MGTNLRGLKLSRDDPFQPRMARGKVLLLARCAASARGLDCDATCVGWPPAISGGEAAVGRKRCKLTCICRTSTLVAVLLLRRWQCRRPLLYER